MGWERIGKETGNTGITAKRVFRNGEEERVLRDRCVFFGLSTTDQNRNQPHRRENDDDDGAVMVKNETAKEKKNCREGQGQEKGGGWDTWQTSDRRGVGNWGTGVSEIPDRTQQSERVDKRMEEGRTRMGKKEVSGCQRVVSRSRLVRRGKGRGAPRNGEIAQ
jgi:hypothetical protein